MLGPVREEPRARVCAHFVCIDDFTMQEPRQGLFISESKLSSSVSCCGQCFQSSVIWVNTFIVFAIALYHLFYYQLQVFFCWTTNYHTLHGLSLLDSLLRVLQGWNQGIKVSMPYLETSVFFKAHSSFERIQFFEIVELRFLLSYCLSNDTLLQDQLERPLIYYDIVDIR